MEVLSHWENLRELIVFTVNDAVKIFRKTPHNTRIYLNRLSKRKIIHQIERNKYTIHKDPFLIASKIYIPSYISLLSALRFHDMTTQLPINIDILTPNRAGSIEFEDTRIQFFRSSYIWGYHNYDYQGFPIAIADPEKALIDCIILKSPIHMVFEALLMRKINIRKTTNYLIKIKNISLMKRMGFLLDCAGLDIYPKVQSYLDSNYVLLERNADKSRLPNSHQAIEKKWKIIQNVVIE